MKWLLERGNGIDPAGAVQRRQRAETRRGSENDRHHHECVRRARRHAIQHCLHRARRNQRAWNAQQQAEANELLSGRPGAAQIRRAGELLQAAADPIDDVRGTADYRRMLIPRLLGDAFAEASSRLEKVHG